MLCDNCAAHSSDIKLTNVKLVFMPPNTTSLIQPMDQGIISNFKQHYRSLVLCHLMRVMETSDENERAAEVARKLTLLDSLHMQKAAWGWVTAATIVNCYRKASFVREEEADGSGDEMQGCSDNNLTDVVNLPAGVTSDEFSLYVAIDCDVQTGAEITDAELFAGQQQVVADGAVSGNGSEMGEEGDNDAGEPTPPVMLAAALPSLDTVRSYLEAAGCESYE